MTKQVSTHHLIKLFFIIFLGTAATAAVLFGITNWKAQTAKAATPRIAYWHLNEASGTSYADAEAGTHPGTCTNCPSAVFGPVNGAQNFDGIDDTIDVSNHTAFDWGSGGTFAVEFWMQANSCTTIDEAFIGRGAAGGEQWYIGCNSTNGTVQFSLEDSTSLSVTLESTKVITDNNWHHLAVTYDGPNNTAWLYVDGSDIVSATTAFTGSFAPSSANVNIGHVDNTMYFNGNLDEIAIYNDIPSLTDFRTHYYLARGYTESCTSSVKMMPLGDSITQGKASGIPDEDGHLHVSYRRDLWQLFNTNGYQVDYVGSLTNGEYYFDTEGFDPNHEGHPGLSDNQIAAVVNTYINDNPADVVLLHVGTNAVEENADSVEQILDKIDTYDERITVVLARIINRNIYNATTTQFNNNIAALAESRIANGDKIIVVDMEPILNYDLVSSGGDMNDNLHPFATGYTKMADVWFDALDDFMPYCPTPPTIASTPVTTGAKNAAYTYDVDARSNIQPVTYSLTITPTGMTINSTTGEILWTPVETGTVNVAVQVANNVGTTPQAFTITVDDPVSPTITSTAITTAVINEPYVYDVDATGYPTPTFSLDPASPGGMTIFTETGRIEWTPTITGTFDVTVTAANSEGTDPQIFAITVEDAPVCPTDISTYWHLDANINDEFHESINNNDATCTGTTCPSEVTGKVNNAVQFDGGDDYITDQNTTSYNWQNSDSFSIELWVNTTQVCDTNKVFIGKYANDAPAWWVGCGNGGNAIFNLRDQLGTTHEIVHTAPITDSIGVWHHIVAIHDGNVNELKLYVDGDGQSVPATYTADFINGSPITMGKYAGAYLFEGMIDETAIYNRALSESEIQFHYNNGAVNTGYCTDVSPAFITSDPVTTAITGEQYSYDVEATGFPVPEFSLAVSQTGMTIITQTGLINWTPTISGTYDVTVKATNSEGSNSQPFTIDVVDPTLPVITSLAVTSGYVNQQYTYDVDATGIPTPQYSLTFTPTGMTINPISGLITWTPTSAGPATVTVVATNTVGASIPQTFDINVVQPVCPNNLTSYWQFESSIFTDTVSGLNAACNGVGCPQIVAGKVGNAAYFDESNGLDAGNEPQFNFSTNESFSLELWVNTTQTCTGNKAFLGKHVYPGASWWVGCNDNNNVATFSLRDSNTTTPTQHQVHSTNPINDGKWHHIVALYDSSAAEIRLYVDGNETNETTSYDTNADFNNNNSLTIGWFNAGGFYRLDGMLDEVAIYDSALTESEILQHYHTEVSYCAGSAKPVIYSTPITTASVEAPYSYDVNAVGITTPIYSFEGTPPTGMTIITQTGLIEWTTPIKGDHPISVKASNPAGDDIQNYILTVSKKPTITPIPDMLHELGGTYSYNVIAVGHPGITYTVVTSPTATGLSIDENSGEISWTPAITGVFNITVTAQNTAGQHQQSYDLTVGTKPAITSSPLLTVVAGSPYSYDVDANGFPTPKFALNTTLSGMTIDTDTGLISWTPGSAGTFNVIVAVSNDFGTTLHSFDIEVTPVPAAPLIVSIATTKATLNQPYVYDVEATGYPDITYSVDTNPATSMSINPNSGEISWTPAITGVFSITVTAQNTEGQNQQNFELTVGEKPTITSSPPLTVVAGSPYSYDVDATGFPTPISYALNTKPEGMTINSNSGLISWTPGSAGIFNVIVAVSNDFGTTLHSFDIEVTAAPVIVSAATTEASLNQPYVYDVQVTGFPNPTFELIVSPDGMIIDESTGLITWTPTSGGEYNVTVRASNDEGYIDQLFTITVIGQYTIFLPVIINP